MSTPPSRSYVVIDGHPSSPGDTAHINLGVIPPSGPSVELDPDLAGTTEISVEILGPRGGQKAVAGCWLDDAARRDLIAALNGIPVDQADHDDPVLRAVCDAVGIPYHRDALDDALDAIRGTAELARTCIAELGKPTPA